MEPNEPGRRPGNPLRRLAIMVGGIGLLVVVWLAFNHFFSGEESPTGESPPAPGELSVNVADGQVFNEPVLRLTGSAPPDQLIFVNGQPIPVGADGAFELTLQLAEGPNLVLVEARDGEGGTTSLARQVVYEPPGASGEAVEREPEVPPAAVPAPWLLALGLGVIVAAVVAVLARRRRPWVNLTTGGDRLELGVTGGAESAVTLILELDRATRVSLFVLDERGRQVTTLLNNRRREAGRHILTWTGMVLGEPVPPGRYTILAQAGGFMARVSATVEVKIEMGSVTRAG